MLPRKSPRIWAELLKALPGQDQATPFQLHYVVSNCLMLELIAVLVVVLWLLGMITSFTLGGLIHVLLVFAVIAILLRLISGRRI